MHIRAGCLLFGLLPEVVALLCLQLSMDTQNSQCMHSKNPIKRNKGTKQRHVVVELQQLKLNAMVLMIMLLDESLIGTTAHLTTVVLVLIV
jgi:hypothetical protein